MTLSTAIRAAVVSMICVAGAAQAAGNVHGGAEMSRAEVIAERNLWAQAGLDQYVYTANLNVDTAEHRKVRAKFEALRNGPAFEQEVARVKAQRAGH